MLRILNNLLFTALLDKAGGAGDGGGTGGSGGDGGQGGGAGGGQAGGNSSDPLFGGAGGAGDAGGQGGNGGAGQGNGQANGGNGGGSGNGGGQNSQTVTIPQNWQEALAQDVRALPQATKYKTVDELVKAHAHLEKTLGSDRIAIPQKGTPLEQMKEVFEKLGVAKELKDYNVELAQGTEVDNDFFNAFKQTAHSVGLLPQQAKALTEWFAKFNTESFTSQVKEAQATIQKELDAYKNELGDTYDQNIAQAKAALNKYVSKEDAQWFREMGLGSNPRFLRLLAKAGEGLKEGQVRGGGGSLNNSMTPAQAMQAIAEIKNNTAHPYWDAKHADHIKAKKEVSQLYQWAYPNKNPIKPTVEDEDSGGGRQQGSTFNFEFS